MSRALAWGRPPGGAHAPVVMGCGLDGPRFRTWAQARGRAILVLALMREVLNEQ